MVMIDVSNPFATELTKFGVGCIDTLRVLMGESAHDGGDRSKLNSKYILSPVTADVP
jgi:hypothetical protein